MGQAVTARIFHADLWGQREGKYTWLAENSVESTDWDQVTPDEPFYLFKPFDKSDVGDYYDWPAINDVMQVNVTGIVTARDHFVVDFDAEPLLQRMRDLRDSNVSDEAIRQKYFQGKGSKKYPPGDSRGWKLPEARKKLREDDEWENRVAPILYRPFDVRKIYNVPWMVDWPRTEGMPQMLAGENYAIVTARTNKFPEPNHFFASKTIVETKCGEASTQSATFSLYLYPGIGKAKDELFEQWPAGKDGRRPNLDPGFVRDIEAATGLTFITDGRGDLESDFGPEDVLAYIYAVFHWPNYRQRYEAMLKLDFPRVPPPEHAERFVTFAKFGHQLLAAHLLEDESLDGSSISYPKRGDNTVEKGYPKYVPPGAAPGSVKAGKVKLEADETHGRVYINADQYFEGVEPEVWQFQIGGYQVCEKWLKDRRGVDAYQNSLTQYPRIVEALRRTIELMSAIEDAA